MNKKNVLAVEECSAMNFIFNSVLKNDFTLTTVKNCYNALHALKSNKAHDLIILNVENGQSENFKFLEHISSSAALKSIKTIVIANYDDEDIKNKSHALGANLYISKPFDPLFLHSSIKGLIGENNPPILKKRKFSFSLNIF